MPFTREAFLAAANSKAGCLYGWAQKGPTRFDCSGLVTWCIKEVGGPDLRMYWGAAKMFSTKDMFPWCKETELEPGDLVFYGPPTSIEHVMIWLGDGTGRVYGATGGGSTTITEADARKRQACVKHKAKLQYRPGLRGFRKLPLSR